jgi:hypothetical protein
MPRFGGGDGSFRRSSSSQPDNSHSNSTNPQPNNSSWALMGRVVQSGTLDIASSPSPRQRIVIIAAARSVGVSEQEMAGRVQVRWDVAGAAEEFECGLGVFVWCRGARKLRHSTRTLSQSCLPLLLLLLLLLLLHTHAMHTPTRRSWSRCSLTCRCLLLLLLLLLFHTHPHAPTLLLLLLHTHSHTQELVTLLPDLLPDLSSTRLVAAAAAAAALVAVAHIHSIRSWSRCSLTCCLTCRRRGLLLLLLFLLLHIHSIRSWSRCCLTCPRCCSASTL